MPASFGSVVEVSRSSILRVSAASTGSAAASQVTA